MEHSSKWSSRGGTPAHLSGMENATTQPSQYEPRHRAAVPITKGASRTAAGIRAAATRIASMVGQIHLMHHQATTALDFVWWLQIRHVLGAKAALILIIPVSIGFQLPAAGAMWRSARTPWTGRPRPRHRG